MSVVSNALRKSAGHHDAHCMLNISGVCDMQGCVLCHIRIAGEVGGGQKPDDFSASFGCGACQVRTIRWWHQHGFIDIRGVK